MRAILFCVVLSACVDSSEPTLVIEKPLDVCGRYPGLGTGPDRVTIRFEGGNVIVDQLTWEIIVQGLTNIQDWAACMEREVSRE